MEDIRPQSEATKPAKPETKPALQLPQQPRKPAKPREYEIARGKNVLVQCPRGKLRGGDRVTPSDVGGPEVLAGLVKAGSVVEKK